MSQQQNSTKIELYTSGTPNGQKSSILFEELNLFYNVHAISLQNNEQKEDWYLAINPNGRIPALVDRTASDTGKRIFESGALLLYLTEKYDGDRSVSFEYDSDDYWECMCWIMFLQGGLGPMQGQANHFYRYAPEKFPYAIDRYHTETKRLYGVLEARLREQQEKGAGLWLVGGRYSIADLNCFCWVNWAEWAGEDLLSAFPKLREWLNVINDRPAVQKGLNVPEKFQMKEKMKTKEGREEYEKFHSSWVMKGQKDDQEKHK